MYHPLQPTWQKKVFLFRGHGWRESDRLSRGQRVAEEIVSVLLAAQYSVINERTSPLLPQDPIIATITIQGG